MPRKLESHRLVHLDHSALVRVLIDSFTQNENTSVRRWRILVVGTATDLCDGTCVRPSSLVTKNFLWARQNEGRARQSERVFTVP